MFNSVKSRVVNDQPSEAFGGPDSDLSALSEYALPTQIEDPVVQMQEKLKILPEPQSLRTIRCDAATRIVKPRTFEAAKVIADHFKSGEAVFLDLQGVDFDLGRRLIDFCSGVCYTEDGGLQKVGNRLFLLVPNESKFSENDLQASLTEIQQSSD